MKKNKFAVALGKMKRGVTEKYSVAKREAAINNFKKARAALAEKRRKNKLK